MKSFWKKFGVVLSVIGFFLVVFAIDGLLNILSDVPFIGPVAKFFRHLRNNAY